MKTRRMTRILMRAAATAAALGLFVLAAVVAGPRRHVGGRGETAPLAAPALAAPSSDIFETETAEGEVVRFQFDPKKEPIVFVKKSAEANGLPPELRPRAGRLLAKYETGGARLFVLEGPDAPGPAAADLTRRFVQAGWSQTEPPASAPAAKLFLKPGWRCLAHVAPAPDGRAGTCVTACVEAMPR